MTDFDVNALTEKGIHFGFAGQLGFMRRPFSHDLRDAEAAVLGAPLDLGVSNRSGARFGPRALREMSAFQLGQLCPIDWFDDHTVVDYGDSFFYPGDIAHAIQTIEHDATAVLRTGTALLTLGGDHTISLPLLRAHAKVHGALSLVHFDSHTDTYDIFPGPWHGSIFETLVQEGCVDPARSAQLGIRAPSIGGGKGFAVLDADWIAEHGVTATVEKVRSLVGRHPTYVSFDVDFLDPAYAPGTGTPVVGGPTTAEARRILRGLSGLNVVGGDVVEVAPPYDAPGQITALAGSAAAFFILELMLASSPPRDEQASRRGPRWLPRPLGGS